MKGTHILRVLQYFVFEVSVSQADVCSHVYQCVCAERTVLDVCFHLLALKVDCYMPYKEHHGNQIKCVKIPKVAHGLGLDRVRYAVDCSRLNTVLHRLVTMH